MLLARQLERRHLAASWLLRRVIAVTASTTAAVPSSSTLRTVGNKESGYSSLHHNGCNSLCSNTRRSSPLGRTNPEVASPTTPPAIAYSTRSNLSRTIDHSRIGNKLQLPLAQERKVLPNVSTLVALQFEIKVPAHRGTLPADTGKEETTSYTSDDAVADEMIMLRYDSTYLQCLVVSSACMLDSSQVLSLIIPLFF